MRNGFFIISVITYKHFKRFAFYSRGHRDQYSVEIRCRHRPCRVRLCRLSSWVLWVLWTSLSAWRRPQTSVARTQTSDSSSKRTFHQKHEQSMKSIWGHSISLKVPNSSVETTIWHLIILLVLIQRVVCFSMVFLTLKKVFIVR